MVRLSQLQDIARLPHTRNIAINTLGNYVGYLFTAFYIVFLVRLFDPVQFGKLAVLQALSYLLANILSFGIPASIYAHLPELLHDKKRAVNFLMSNFIFSSLLSGGSLIILYLLSPLLDLYILKTGVPVSYYAYAYIGTQLFIWQNFVRDALNAAGHFLHINIAINISHLVKIVLLLACAYYQMLGIPEVLIITSIAGPLVVFLYVALERKWIVKALMSAVPSRQEVKGRYTFTYFLATQMFNLATRTDLFLISYFLTRPEVGYYGLSQRIILAVITSSDSITQVMSAQFSKVSTQTEVRKLMKHSYLYMLVPTAMFIVGILVPDMVYNAVFSSSYSKSIILTRALSLAYLPYSFLAAVLLFFLYTIKKPRYLFICNTLFFCVIVVGNLVFIPYLRLISPAMSYGIAFAIVLLYIGYIFKRELQKLPA